jgi:hypothetical protein
MSKRSDKYSFAAYTRNGRDGHPITILEQRKLKSSLWVAESHAPPNDEVAQFETVRLLNCDRLAGRIVAELMGFSVELTDSIVLAVNPSGICADVRQL